MEQLEVQKKISHFLDEVLCWGRNFNKQYTHLDNVLTWLQSIPISNYILALTWIAQVYASWNRPEIYLKSIPRYAYRNDY